MTCILLCINHLKVSYNGGTPIAGWQMDSFIEMDKTHIWNLLCIHHLMMVNPGTSIGVCSSFHCCLTLTMGFKTKSRSNDLDDFEMVPQ